MKATLVLALVTVAAATIMTATVEGAAGTAKAQPFAVTSSLDGKSVLPRRIHWIARVQVASSKVRTSTS
jgi:hypothetical protein